MLPRRSLTLIAVISITSLVVVSLILADNGRNGGGEQPVTPPRVADISSPRADKPLTQPAHFYGDDVTALPSDRYAEVVSHGSPSAEPPLMDPRSITQREYPDEPPLPRVDKPSGVVRTRPIAHYRPIPMMAIRRDVTARLSLIVDDRGHVREVSVRQAIGSHTAELVNAVRTWRFQPGTENGRPVSSAYSVDIEFRTR